MTETVLITGGTGKFGRRYVEHFLAKGWYVVFTSTSEARVGELESRCADVGKCVGVAVDLLEENAASVLFEQVVDKGITVNHLVNNARSLDTLRVDDAGFSRRADMLNEYMLGVVVAYELATGLWVRQADGLNTVTNIGSQYGIVAANPNLYGDRRYNGPIHYGVTKAALHQMTRELSVRMAPDDIRVNAIAYGGVEGRTDQAFRDRYAAMVPNGRMLSEDEIVGPLDFLTSPLSSSVTGHVLSADGGWTAW